MGSRGLAWFTPLMVSALAHGADFKCPERFEAIVATSGLPQYQLTRLGEVERWSLLRTQGTFSIKGDPEVPVHAVIERVAAWGKPKRRPQCAELTPGVTYRLPEVEPYDHFRIALWGTLQDAEQAAFKRMRDELLGKQKEVLKDLDSEWPQFARTAFIEQFPLEELVEVDFHGKHSNYQEMHELLEGARTGPCTKPSTMAEAALCRELSELVLLFPEAYPADLEARYQRRFTPIQTVTDQKAFCAKAAPVEVLERYKGEGKILLSAVELPSMASDNEVSLSLGETGDHWNRIDGGDPVTVWLKDVPIGSEPKVTWAKAEPSQSDIQTLAQFLTTLTGLVLRATAPGHAAVLTPANLLPTLIENTCSLEKESPPAVALRGARVKVSAPVGKGKNLTLTACTAEGCREVAPETSLRATAQVHTLPRDWRLTLVAAFAGNVPTSGQRNSNSFSTWRWRPVGATGGAQQLVEYTRVSSPLDHLSASLLLTGFTPCRLGSAQFGLGVGPALMVGPRLAPLRQWSGHVVLGFDSGVVLTIGGGVRFTDEPMDPAREGERRLVKGDTYPDVDQRLAARGVFSIGFGLDTAALVDGGAALINAIGGGK